MGVIHYDWRFLARLCVITAESVLTLTPDNKHPQTSKIKRHQNYFVRFSRKILVSSKNVCRLKAVELITGFKQDSGHLGECRMNAPPEQTGPCVLNR